MSLDDYKEQKNLPHIKTIIMIKLKCQTKNLKKTLKASHILIKVKSSSSDKEGLSDKKLKRK